MNNSVNNESKAELYKKPNQLSVLYYLVKRHFKVFWKNHTLVLFSLMVPLVVLVVYVIFLRPMEVSQLDAAIKEGLGFEFDPENATKEALELVHKIRGIADEWMIAGVLSVSCITVALNTEMLWSLIRRWELQKTLLLLLLVDRQSLFHMLCSMLLLLS